MLRNYITDTTSIFVNFPNEAYEYFLPGTDIDIIDIGILKHIHTLPLFLARTCDGPSKLVVETVTTSNGDYVLFFEFSELEFHTCYPLFNVQTELTMKDRLNRLVKNGLLTSVQSDEFPDVTLYRTTELYEELFVC